MTHFHHFNARLKHKVDIGGGLFYETKPNHYKANILLLNRTKDITMYGCGTHLTTFEGGGIERVAKRQ